MRLSVLDQSPIAQGSTGALALRNSLALGRMADKLGYERFWMAEHHATPALASASPEILLAAIGEATTRIRIGTGGVMLPHYSPFKVAESFSMLAALFPGRVDLGLGRAPGSDPLSAFALQQDRRTRALNDFPQDLLELLAHFDRALPGDHPFHALGSTLPGSGAQPDIWVLGSSSDSADLAGALGLPYCVADFIAGEVPELAARYRAAFRPSPRAAKPELMVACWTIAAADAEEAAWLAGPSRMMFAQMLQGRLIPVPSPETASAWLADHPSPIPPNRRPVLGSPVQCRALLEQKAQRYGADQLMLVNILHDHADRSRSYQLIAEEMIGAPASPTLACA
jgi:luciferase family oxidoreductase group 1